MSKIARAECNGARANDDTDDDDTDDNGVFVYTKASAGDLYKTKKEASVCGNLSFEWLGYPDNKALNPIDFYLIQMFVNY